MKSAHVVFTLESRVRDKTFADQAAADVAGREIETQMVGLRINGVEVRSVRYQPSGLPKPDCALVSTAGPVWGKELTALRAAIDEEIAYLVEELAGLTTQRTRSRRR